MPPVADRPTYDVAVTDVGSQASGPMVVAVDASRRDADALTLARLLQPVLDAPIVVAHAHPYGRLGSLLDDGEHENLLRVVTDRVSEHVAEAGDAAR